MYLPPSTVLGRASKSQPPSRTIHFQNLLVLVEYLNR